MLTTIDAYTQLYTHLERVGGGRACIVCPAPRVSLEIEFLRSEKRFVGRAICSYDITLPVSHRRKTLCAWTTGEIDILVVTPAALLVGIDLGGSDGVIGVSMLAVAALKPVMVLVQDADSFAPCELVQMRGRFVPLTPLCNILGVLSSLRFLDAAAVVSDIDPPR